MSDEAAEFWKTKYADELQALRLTKVDAGFDIFSLSTEAPYAFNRTPDGNLWFAKVVKSHPRARENEGAEVYRFDGEHSTRFVIEGNVLEGDSIDQHCEFSSDAEGTVWYFKRPTRQVPVERPIFAITARGELASWGEHPARDEVEVGGKRCRIEEVEPGTTYAQVDARTGRTLSKFDTEATYGRVQALENQLVLHNASTLEVRGPDGKIRLVLRWDDLESDAFFSGQAFDFEAPCALDADHLLVPFASRQGRGTYLYVLDLRSKAFTPHPFNGKVKARPDRCLFDRKGRLWVSHVHSPSLFWTTFTVVDDGEVRRLDDGTPGKAKPKAVKKATAPTQAKGGTKTGAKKAATTMKHKDPRIAIALAALDRFAKDYQTKVGTAVRRFYSEGTPFALHGRSYQETESTSYQACAVVPHWSSQEELDDAAVGTKGDWKAAGRFLPIFRLGDGRFFVVDLASPHGAVHLFDEEALGAKGRAYVPTRRGILIGDLDKVLAEVESPSSPVDLDGGGWSDGA